MRESTVVKVIESALKSESRYHVNFHGSLMSSNGVTDFLTVDSDGVMTGVEAKAPGAGPTVNQYRQMIYMLLSGAKVFIAYDDFSVGMIDGSINVPKFELGARIGEDDFDAVDQFKHLAKKSRTVEVVLRR